MPAAQRLALYHFVAQACVCVSTGSTTRRAWTLLGSRKNSKRRMLENAARAKHSPTRQVHQERAGAHFSRQNAIKLHS